MANIKSAKKRIKTSEKSRQLNKAEKTKISSLRRKLTESTAAGDKDASVDTFSKYCSALDKAAKKGTIKSNTANRRKSRASALVSSM